MNSEFRGTASFPEQQEHQVLYDCETGVPLANTLNSFLSTHFSLPAQTRNTFISVLWVSDLMANNDQAARNLVVLSHVGFIKDTQTALKRKVSLKFLSHD